MRRRVRGKLPEQLTADLERARVGRGRGGTTATISATFSTSISPTFSDGIRFAGSNGRGSVTCTVRVAPGSSNAP
jgi:hypothetical protein